MQSVEESGGQVFESGGQVFELKSISWFHSKTCPPDSSLRKLRREYCLWNRVIT